MSNESWTDEGEALTTLILDVFQLNGRLLIAGDRLVSELGLTSARWQVLGAIANAERAESVAWHARTMGVHRQGVQRIVNELKKEGIIDFLPNPHHKRAHLVILTAMGKELYEAAIALQIPWVNALSNDISVKDIKNAQEVINAIKNRLELDSTFNDNSIK